MLRGKESPRENHRSGARGRTENQKPAMNHNGETLPENKSSSSSPCEDKLDRNHKPVKQRTHLYRTSENPLQWRVTNPKDAITEAAK